MIGPVPGGPRGSGLGVGFWWLAGCQNPGGLRLGRSSHIDVAGGSGVGREAIEDTVAIGITTEMAVIPGRVRLNVSMSESVSRVCWMEFWKSSLFLFLDSDASCLDSVTTRYVM